jgi:hypothetical protein
MSPPYASRVAIGLELDSDGVVHALDDATWQARHRRSEELGGAML